MGPEGFDSTPKPGTCAGLLPRHVTSAPGLMPGNQSDHMSLIDMSVFVAFVDPLTIVVRDQHLCLYKRTYLLL